MHPLRLNAQPLQPARGLGASPATAETSSIELEVPQAVLPGRCRQSCTKGYQGGKVEPGQERRGRFLQVSELSLNAVDCRSRASVRASAWLSDKRASSGDIPLARDFDQMRRTDAGDHGSAASDNHCLSGGGRPSNAAMGSPARRLRRRLLSPRLRLMLVNPGQSDQTEN